MEPVEAAADVGPHRFVLHPTTEALVELLRGVDEGEMILYPDISATAGGDVQGPSYRYLASARRIVAKEGLVFLTVRNEGLRRATPSGALEESERRRGHIRRAARREGDRLARIEYERLTAVEQRKHTALGAAYALVAAAATKRALNKLEGRAEAGELNTGDAAREAAAALAEK